MTYISIALRRLVSERAGYRCEYCLLPEEFSSFSYEPDHIIPLKHGGATTAENLALACFWCNRLKGSDLAAPDPPMTSPFSFLLALAMSLLFYALNVATG